LQAAKFQRLYILLRPCAKGGGGYARLEQVRGKYTLTVNAHGFSPSEEGIRVLLAARDEGGGSAVCDLGALPISTKGQSSLRREVASMPGGLSLSSYSALCIAKDWPHPKLLLMGALEENNSISTYLMEETVSRYLSVPSRSEDVETSTKESKTPSVSSPAPQKALHPAAGAIPAPANTPASVPPLTVPQPTVNVQPIAVVSPVASALVHPNPLSAAVPAIPPVLPVKTDILPDFTQRELIPFPLVRATPPPRPVSEPTGVRAVASIPADEQTAESLDPAVFTSAMERAVFPPDIPAAGPLSGRPPVNGLPKLNWPAAVKELENYFFTYPPFAPFDAPGWRFVQVPMAAGSTIPYYVVGMLARDGKVTQVAYAVPGDRGALPPPGFSGYRWQQGRNGQGYWTLWKRA